MSENITIEVRIFASLREVIGVKNFKMTLRKGITISEFLELIREKFTNGKAFVKEVLDPADSNRIKYYVKFMINGKILVQDEILDTTIENEGDVIAIFPPIGGG